MGRRARWKQGAKAGPGRRWCGLREHRWREEEVAEASLSNGWTCPDLGASRLSQHPAHLHTELPNLQLQLPHLGSLRSATMARNWATRPSCSAEPR